MLDLLCIAFAALQRPPVDQAKVSYCEFTGAPDVPLATFNNAPGTTHDWVAVNDPVMGGASVSSLSVHDGVGAWVGEVKVVPSLGAPGFCTVRTKGDENVFPDCSTTKSLALAVSYGSGLPTNAFAFEVGVQNVTSAQVVYHADFTDEFCCADFCRVPWSAFKLSFRGKPVAGPPLTEHLHKITHIGIGTSGTAGKFEVDLLSFIGTNNSSQPCPPG